MHFVTSSLFITLISPSRVFLYLANSSGLLLLTKLGILQTISNTNKTILFFCNASSGLILNEFLLYTLSSIMHSFKIDCTPLVVMNMDMSVENDWSLKHLLMSYNAESIIYYSGCAIFLFSYLVNIYSNHFPKRVLCRSVNHPPISISLAKFTNPLIKHNGTPSYVS